MSLSQRRLRGPYPRTLFRGGQFKGAWYDFSDPSTMYADAAGAQITSGTGIYTLLDKSGNQNTLTQSTSGSRPAWNSGGYAAFDGTDDWIACTSDLGFSSNGVVTPNWTMLALLSSASPSTADYVFTIGHTSASGVLAVATGTSTASTLIVFQRNDTATGGQTGSNALQTNAYISTPQFIGVQRQGELNHTVAPWRCYLGNAPTLFSGQDVSGTYTMNQFTIGALRRNTITAGSYLNMNLYQFLLINRCLGQNEVNGVMSHWRGLTGL